MQAPRRDRDAERNALEMMRRGVPLSKSDLAGGTISSQCQLHGLAPWLPYFGAGCAMSKNRYYQRSNLAPWIGTAENLHEDTLDYALRNLDTDKTERISGRELMDEGLQVTITDQPGSPLIRYRKAQ